MAALFGKSKGSTTESFEAAISKSTAKLIGRKTSDQFFSNGVTNDRHPTRALSSAAVHCKKKIAIFVVAWSVKSAKTVGFFQAASVEPKLNRNIHVEMQENNISKCKKSNSFMPINTMLTKIYSEYVTSGDAPSVCQFWWARESSGSALEKLHL